VRPLITAEELAHAVTAGTIVVADVRWYLDGRSARSAYEEGHIPGAVFIDVEHGLAAPGRGPGRHPLPSPGAFAAVMSEAGIGDDDTVVAYDDAGGSIAARLWWMLRATGHRAAVLDGGLAAWPGAFEGGAPKARPPAEFTARPWPSDRVIDAGAVDAMRASPAAVVLDARSTERYRGDVEPVDPRAGHIPGARSAPWSANIGDDGTFRSPSALRQRFEALGITESTRVACYCGSGITACHDILALELAGFRGGLLYEGSWSDWSGDPARPASTGADRR
jgi:thiosulfate/3-mercaptopyruvate sulfurtransferase